MRLIINSLLIIWCLALYSPALVADNFNKKTPLTLQEQTTINDLSRDLLVAKLKHSGLNNTIVSSVSLYYALSILHEGAAGNTKALLNELLLQEDAEDILANASKLSAIIQSANSDLQTEYNLASFHLENSIWATTGETNSKPFFFADSFMQSVKTHYNADDARIDFLKPGASEIINHWVDKNTNGLIDEIINDDTLKEFAWIVLNTLYFEGAWSVKMNRIKHPDNYRFKDILGEEYFVETIRSAFFRTQVDDFSDGSMAFSLPFLGNKYSFVVYLPDENLSSFDQWLVQKAVPNMPNIIDAHFNTSCQPVDLKVRMPVFTYEDGVSLKRRTQITADLGLTDLFEKDADFSLLPDLQKTSAYVSKTTVELIKQDTKIELDENGVRAAAATLIGGVGITSATRPIPRREIIVNRPFIYAIVENTSRTILFNGVITKLKEI